MRISIINDILKLITRCTMYENMKSKEEVGEEEEKRIKIL